eukprot:UN30373
MISYEPDFMNQNYNCMPTYQKDVHSASDWLDAMAGEALSRNIPVQWCYATPSNLLQALNYPSVTNFRGSFDYYYGHSYDIGFASVLIWSLGAFPSKDTFWTTDNGNVATTLGGCDKKKGCPADHSNTSAPLHTILTVMSTGPVGFSDAINHTDGDLIRRTINDNGDLLKPSKALTPIDSTFSNNPPDGDIYTTFSGTVENPIAYYFLT